MDVRLTMGGEPTFVSVSDREGAEWNTAALGPTKRGYALELLNRLRTRYGGNGFLHFGQGKWYPGEQLPRWALSIYWRTDGQPCWEDPTLFADERQRSAYTVADARRFMARLCERLGVGGQTVVPGYEDVFYYLWRDLRAGLERRELRRRIRRIGQAQALHLAVDVWLGDDGGDGLVQAIDHSRRRPATPASCIVGTSGMTSVRLADVTASARTLPLCT
ncbi:hypothetical protein G6F62_013532 [Rhizopus arrhizus]|nr:hypothetical protein G6F62_013532 [Rhizopus arrhizus]